MFLQQYLQCFRLYINASRCRSSGCLPGTRSLTPSVMVMQDLQQLMADKEASKQEAIQDAVANAAEEKQKVAAQADQVRLWFAGLL